MWIFKFHIFIFLVFTYQLCVYGDELVSPENETDTPADKIERVISRFGEDDDEFPTETQTAQCTITAGEVRASAQASTSKKLEGVCGSKEMRKSFEKLENLLMQELYMMKLMIAQLQYPNINIIPNYLSSEWGFNGNPNPNHVIPHLNPPKKSSYNFNPITTTTTTTPIPSTTTPAAPINIINQKPIFVSSTTTTKPTPPKKDDVEFQPILFPSDFGNRFGESNESPIIASSAPPPVAQGLDMKAMKPTRRPKPNPRDFEIHRFNNTILSNDDTQIFTYFWIMENFSQKLLSNLTEITSPIFTISGLHLRVRAILNHLNRNNLYLKIESVPHEIILREKSPNIVLKSGNIFKEIETKKLFRHKIIIMDQGSTSQADMISQEFFNTNSGFMIPTDAITSSSYSKDDSILIKVIIYL